MNNEIISHSELETEKFAEEFAKGLKGTEIIAMYGTMGMGKTAFTRGLTKGLGSLDDVSSPTFAIVNEYKGKYPIYHFDMYRITNLDDLYSTGFFDYINNGIMIIEWSENIESQLPNDDIIKINISPGKEQNERIIEIVNNIKHQA